MVASKPTRNSAARIWCYDYAPSLGSKAESVYAPRSIKGLENGMVKGAQQRIIVLEDLDVRSIGLVGTTFRVPPTVFERHLEGSGYSDVSPHDTKSRLHMGSELTTSDPMSAECVSITWLRPVVLSLGINEQERKDLLRAKQPRMECIFPDCAQSRRSHGAEAKTNILRGAVGLSTSNGDGLPKSFPVGWEERVTVYKTRKDLCPTRKQSSSAVTIN